MRRGLGEDAAGLVMVALGTVGLQMALTGDALWFVKPSMRWPLGASGLLLVGVGLLTVIGATRRHGHAGDHAGHDHGDHDHPSGVGLLLVAPLLALLLVAPSALGASAADRRLARIDTEAPLGPLPAPVDGTTVIPLLEVMQRHARGEQGGLAGLQLRLVGFVAEPTSDGFVLTRFRLACCAADASVAKVRIVGVPAPAADAWVEVVGPWVPGATELPVVAASRVTPVATPANPYE